MTDDAARRPSRGGRPKAEPGERISTYVRVSDYDRLVRLAFERNETVAKVVRDLLKLKLR